MHDDDALCPIRRLHTHRRWVNDQLRAAARTLDEGQLDRVFEMGLGTLRLTLTHLYAAEYVWLEALLGTVDTPSPRSITFDSVGALEKAWVVLEDRWSAYLASLTVAALGEPVVKSTTFGGSYQRFSSPRADVLLHVCTHAQYTTAQAVNMLRHVGVAASDLPDSMLITMSRRGL